MANVATPLMTVEEFFDWTNLPENEGRRFELSLGQPRELIPWPTSFTTDYHRLLGLLTDYVIHLHRGSVAMVGDGVIVSRNPDTVRCPAVMVFFTQMGDDFPPRYTTEVPALVVDFSPPGDRYGLITPRILDYIRHGVGQVWLIEPTERTVLVANPGVPFDVFSDGDELTAPDVLPEFRCRVADLFALPGSAPA